MQRISVSISATSCGQWLANTVYNEAQWPHDIAEGLVEMAVEHIVKAAMTFPKEAGLGWDQLHPRALCRLSLGTLI